MKIRSLPRVLVILLLFLFTSACGVFSDTSDGNLNVHFIDVGQGDSILIVTPSRDTILIDAGSLSAGSDVVKYINRLGIDRLDYAIATHPHEDHIGGLPEVIKAFNIGEIYMPEAVATTKAFDDLMDAVEEAGLYVSVARGGKTFYSKDDVKVEFLSPNSEFDNVNNMSAVIAVSFGNARFLFMGDAEAEAELDMLRTDQALRADVLKIGHHGSSTSTTDEFLVAVKPSIAVIFCAQANSYGHPDAETIKRLDRYASVYRTDIDGNIIVSTDGAQLHVFR